MSRNTYRADPSDLRRVLTRAEVRELVAARGKGFLGNKTKVMHFVERVLLTLEETSRRQQALEALNMDLRAQISARTGYASSMDPEMALAYVEPSILAKHGNMAAQQMADAAEAKSKRFEVLRADLRSRLLDAVESGELTGNQELVRDLIAILDQA